MDNIIPTELTETVNGFRDEFFFLSNFQESPVSVTYQNQSFTFLTGEHVFQGMKVAAAFHPENNILSLRELESAATPAKAKYWGRSIKIDSKKWNTISLACMKRTVELKFGQNPPLTELLLATGGIRLVEYNDWNDKLWGKSQTTREGANQLGILLMELRSKIRGF